MKFLLALASLVALASGKRTYRNRKVNLNKGISAESEQGSKLLSKARRLDQEVDFTWVAGYSIKFQGCHHISQWNEEADGEEDVRIQTKRLVRFRLCPSSDCTEVNAGGCTSGYGEYIIDMNIFLEAYFESVENYNEWKCEYLEEMVCGCNNGRKLAEGEERKLDEDYCLWDCFEEQGMAEVCMDNNPYNQNEDDEEEFELQEYMECANWEPRDNNRRLDQNEIEYFMGPYCSDNGGAIYLGLFTDETCTTFADEYGGRSTYKSLQYDDMPYGEKSIIDMECISCKEPEDFNNDGNDNQDEDEVIEMCEQIYEQAGKCESNLDYSVTGQDLNENACNYMEGITIVRQNGVVHQNATKANKTATIFIAIFVVAFVLLAAYVYYLKTKLDRASINLAE